jgi:uncharacterized membrane protein YagU involved in acid resistance
MREATLGLRMPGATVGYALILERLRKASMNGAMRGILGGFAATTAMSIPMLAAQRLGWMATQPPERITATALKATSVNAATEGTHDLVAVAAHYGFGIGCGALFGMLHDRWRPPGPAILHGVAFGLCVWALSYLGWIPSLRILPPAHRDRPGRRRTMVVSHVVYGVVLGATASRDRD